MTIVGANADALDQAATMLNAAAGQLDADSAKLHTTLRGVSWLGPVAAAFTHVFEGDHQPRLHTTANFIRDAARKLTANARQQRDASLSNGGGHLGGGWMHTMPLPGIVHGAPGSPPQVVHVDPAPAQSTPFKDEFNKSDSDLRSGFKGDWHEGKNTGMDQWNFGYGGLGDCTSYVAWRLNKLAVSEGLGDLYFTNNNLGSRTGLHFGNAGEWGASATNQLGIQPDMNPRPGAVALFNGHVAIVRSFDKNTGALTIEQSSAAYAGSPGYDFKIQTIYQKPGSWYPTGFLHLLPNT